MTPRSVWKTAAALTLAATLCACTEHEAAGNAETSSSPPPQAPASGWAMGTAQGVGGRFGARDPRTCPTINTGKLSQIEAQQLFICDSEHVSADGASLSLVSDLTFNLGAARRYTLADKTLDPDINTNWLLYPVFGSFHAFSCPAPAAGAAAPSCTLSVHAKGVGTCYMTMQSGWHCAMADPAPAVQPNQPPPPAGA